MLAFPLIVMLAHQGPLFVPASTGYNELRYVYTVFKIDFTEKRKASDSSAPNARLQSNIEQGSRLSTQASIANIPYSQHSEQMNNVYYLIPFFFFCFFPKRRNSLANAPYKFGNVRLTESHGVVGGDEYYLSLEEKRYAA